MSIFNDVGLVWTENLGTILIGRDARKITEKPNFSFKFQSLYCEPTLCIKVVNGFDHELTDAEIKEVHDYLLEEAKKPRLVNGVDKDGKYLEGVTEDKVVRIVGTAPPKEGVWRIRLDIEDSENWYQPICINSNNEYIDTPLSEKEVIAIVPEGPPHNELDEQWKWDKKKKTWVDSRPKTEIISYLRELKTNEKHIMALEEIENSFILVQLNGNEYKININLETKTALQDIISTGTSRVDWFFKGSTDSTSITLKQAKSILADIIEARQKIMDQYFAHKAAIKELTDIETLKNY